MREQYGKEKGDRVFWAYINQHKLDETKPFPKKLPKKDDKKPKKEAESETQESKKEIQTKVETKVFDGDLSFKMYMPIEKAYDETTGKLVYFGGIASNTDIDRDNERISPNLLQKMAEDLKKNSTVFFNHKHDELPIGKVVDAYVEGNNLKVKIMPSKAKAVEDIITQISEGVLRSFSIGGKVKKAESVYDPNTRKTVKEIKDLDLYEVSVVGVPANPGATIGEFISKAFKDFETKGEKMDKYDMDASGSTPSAENEGSLLHTVAGIKRAQLFKSQDVGAGKLPAQPGGIVSGETRAKPQFQKEAEDEADAEAEGKVRKDDLPLSRESYGGRLPERSHGIVSGGTREKPQWTEKEEEAEAEAEDEAKIRKEPAARFKEAESKKRKEECVKEDEAEDEDEDEDESEDAPKHPDRPMYDESTYKEDEEESSPFASPKMPPTRGSAVPPVKKSKKIYKEVTEEYEVVKKIHELEKELQLLKKERRTGMVKGLVSGEKFDDGSEDVSDEEFSFVKMIKRVKGFQ